MLSPKAVGGKTLPLRGAKRIHNSVSFIHRGARPKRFQVEEAGHGIHIVLVTKRVLPVNNTHKKWRMLREPTGSNRRNLQPPQRNCGKSGDHDKQCSRDRRSHQPWHRRVIGHRLHTIAELRPQQQQRPRHHHSWLCRRRMIPFLTITLLSMRSISRAGAKQPSYKLCSIS